MFYAAALGTALSLGRSGGTDNMQDFVTRYSADLESVDRFYHLPLSEKSLSRKEAVCRAALNGLAQLEYDSLDLDGKIDWFLVRNHAESVIRDLPNQRAKQHKVLKVIPFAAKIVELEEARWTLEPLDAKRAAKQLEDIRAAAAEAWKEFEPDKGTKKPEPTVSLDSAKALAGIRQGLAQWYRHYSGYKPEFTFWCQKPYEQLDKELAEDERALREDIAGQKGKDDDPLVGSPIGEARLSADLQREMLGYEPGELVAIAESEYEWCLARLKETAAEMGLGDDWKEAIEKTKDDYVEPGGQDELVMKQGREAEAFLEKHDLVTVDPLCKETWRVDMLTADQQRNWPFAFYGGQHMATSSPLPEMSHSTKLMALRGNNKHFIHAVTFHELVPGHHLQRYMADRHSRYRSVFNTPFFVEGWALHWEMLLWDLGFNGTPEEKVGALFWRMHRCERIIVSLKYHLGQMTPEEMIDRLVDRVGHERWTATSEVRRYVGDMYSPLYQCAYMIGGLQLRAIYKDLVPRKVTPREFHDTVLRVGPIPMPMVRALVTRTAPDKDVRTFRDIRASFEAP